jgi:hypothetical protein
MPREWFSLPEIAAMQLRHMPGSRQGVRRLSIRENWADPLGEGVTWRRRKGRGGGVEFHHSLWMTSAARPVPGSVPIPTVKGRAPGRQTSAQLELLELRIELVRLEERKRFIKQRMDEVRRERRGVRA